jgi:adhesin transport system outer membrane protein
MALSLSRKIYFTLFLLTIGLAPEICMAEGTSLHQSVEQALISNPQLQALNYNRQAVQYDLRQAWGGYLPTVDISLGYGLEQHSDAFTRRSNTEPGDEDWDTRSDATLRLTQPIYDGGDVGSQVSIQKASLDAADYQLKAAMLSVTVDTITAHLNVLRQQEVVSLAEKNLRIHREIHQSLDERERAGAGSIADVTQVQARLARAESTLSLSKANLKRTIANYTRVVGVTPGNLTYAGVPEPVPQSLEEILRQVEQGNPELLATEAEIIEAESRVSLARTNYKPKIDLELSSNYHDQLEGAESWENTNAAMVNLSWNLYKGGQDLAGTNAALSRKRQSRSKRAAKWAELTEATETAWANYLSLQQQKASYLDEVKYSRMTFDAYLKQFSVSQRSLLDVLSAENEYFQSAVQLMTADVNETIAAYQLLSLTGTIQPTRFSDSLPDFYQEMNHSLQFRE